MCLNANNKGFTFIEILVSLGLIGLISYFLIDITVLSNRLIVDNRAEMDLLQTLRNVNSHVSDASVCEKNFLESGELVERTYSRLLDEKGVPFVEIEKKIGEFKSILVKRIETKVNPDKSFTLFLDFERLLGTGLKNYRRSITLFTKKKTNGGYECFSAGMAIAKKAIATACDDIFNTQNYSYSESESYSGCERKEIKTEPCTGSELSRGINISGTNLISDCTPKQDIKVACGTGEFLTVNSQGSFFCAKIKKADDVANFFQPHNCSLGDNTFSLAKSGNKMTLNCSVTGTGTTSTSGTTSGGGEERVPPNLTLTIDDRNKNGSCIVNSVKEAILPTNSIWSSPFLITSGSERRYNYSRKDSYYQYVAKLNGSNDLQYALSVSGRVFLTGAPYSQSHFNALTAAQPKLHFIDEATACPDSVSYEGTMRFGLNVANAPTPDRPEGQMQAEIQGISVQHKDLFEALKVVITYSNKIEDKAIDYIISTNPDGSTKETKRGRLCVYSSNTGTPDSVAAKYTTTKAPIFALSYQHITDGNGGGKKTSGIGAGGGIGGILLGNNFDISQVDSFAKMGWDVCNFDAGGRPIAKYLDGYSQTSLFSDPNYMVLDMGCPKYNPAIVLAVRFETKMLGTLEDKLCYDCSHNIWDNQISLYAHRNCINEAISKSAKGNEQCSALPPDSSCIESDEKIEFKQVLQIYPGSDE